MGLRGSKKKCEEFGVPSLNTPCQDDALHKMIKDYAREAPAFEL